MLMLYSDVRVLECMHNFNWAFALVHRVQRSFAQYTRCP